MEPIILVFQASHWPQYRPIWLFLHGKERRCREMAVAMHDIINIHQSYINLNIRSYVHGYRLITVATRSSECYYLFSLKFQEFKCKETSDLPPTTGPFFSFDLLEYISSLQVSQLSLLPWYWNMQYWWIHNLFVESQYLQLYLINSQIRLGLCFYWRWKQQQLFGKHLSKKGSTFFPCSLYILWKSHFPCKTSFHKR